VFRIIFWVFLSVCAYGSLLDDISEKIVHKQMQMDLPEVKGKALTFSLQIDNRQIKFSSSKEIAHRLGIQTQLFKSGNGKDHAVLTRKNGRVVGTVTVDGKRYAVSTDTNGKVILVKEDPKFQRKFQHDFHLPKRPDMLPGIKPVTEKEEAQTENGSSSSSGESSVQNGVTVIDLMIFYTQAFTDYYGEDTDLLIQNFVDQANQSFVNSHIDAYYNVVHTQLLTLADVNESIDMSTALDNLQENEEVKDLRDTHNADMVSLIRKYPDKNDGCGISYMLYDAFKDDIDAFKPYAYNVVEVKRVDETTNEHPYYCSELSLTHELGHNLGCAHDRDHANNGGLFSYSYGYDHDDSDDSKDFATIMSYDPGEIAYFSNPDIERNGIPIGIAQGEEDEADNAATIQQSKKEIADFYLPDTCTGGFVPKQGDKSLCVPNTTPEHNTTESTASCPSGQRLLQGTEICEDAAEEGPEDLGEESDPGCELIQGTTECS